MCGYYVAVALVTFIFVPVVLIVNSLVGQPALRPSMFALRGGHGVLIGKWMIEQRRPDRGGFDAGVCVGV